MYIRKTLINDLDSIMKIYGHAKSFMHTSGNPNQWNGAYPDEETIKDDIKRGESYVIVGDDNIVHGVFMLHKGIDDTYNVIYDGKWIDDSSYAVIHRIARDTSIHNVIKFVKDYVIEEIPHIRIDTHKDNKVMQNALIKAGFIKCGIIYLKNGDPRVAFEYTTRRS